MELVDEHLRSYINGPENLGLLKWITYNGDDICATWWGKYSPATTSDDEEMADLARFSREHYFLYLWFIANYMERRGHVLDIGCGSGHRTNMLSRYAKSVVGIDIDSEKLRFASKCNGGGRITYYKGLYPDSFHEMKPNPTFDYIFASEIIEHVALENQPEFLAFALGSLRKDGRMFITCPRDRVVKRAHPHIGLWDQGQWDGIIKSMGSRALYHGYVDITGLNCDSKATLDNLYVGPKPSDHYLMVLG